jgi:outer membrane protein assembly factor BamB
VQGQNVILNIGGSDGAGIVALDKNTGALRWKATEDEASYSSPVIGDFGGNLKAVVFTREGVVLLDPADGHVSARMHWRSRAHASVNAAAPLIIGEKVFLTASYETGAILLDASGGTLKKIWSADNSLSSHYATPVERDGYLYGFHGRQEYGPSFRAVELATGKVAWNEEGFGAGTVTLVGDKLLILRESGELLLADASPKSFQKRGTLQILGSGTRAYPAVSNHRLYARDKSSLVCVSLP